jgi:ABC-type dipeptide/oligopeptide/nickel transport system permease component
VVAVGSSLALLPSLIPSTLFAYAFGIRLGWLPSPRLMSIAIVTLTPLAVVALATLGEYERILASNHVRFARSLGYGDWRLLLAYGLKEALPGLVGNLSNVVLYLVTATVFVEIIFSEHGLGQLLLDATQRLDYPIILGFGLLMVAVIGAMNLLTGLILYVSDPRVR